MRYLSRILAVLLVLSLGANVFLLTRDKESESALPARTVDMSWTFDWQELPDQTMQQELLLTPWRINQQIGLWLFGIDPEQYQEIEETDDRYADIMSRHGQTLLRDGMAKPGMYGSQDDPDEVFVCTYYKPDGTYTGYRMRYSDAVRGYELQSEQVKDGIIIALE